MPRIVLARELQHEQIEFPAGTPFPEGRRGGGQSSLHLRRGSVRDVTPEELSFIRASRPEVFRCLDVLPEPKTSPALLRKLKAMDASRRREAVEKASSAVGGTQAPPSPVDASSTRVRARKPKPETDAG